MTTTVLVVVALVAAYVLIATERIHRVAAARCGAAAMVVLGVVDTKVAFFSETTGVDWNVIYLLLGMMVIVSVTKQTGAFEYVAIWAAERTRGRPFATMVLLVCITALASALLDNVTAVLLIAPVTLLVCNRLGLPPVPFLIAEACWSASSPTPRCTSSPRWWPFSVPATWSPSPGWMPTSFLRRWSGPPWSSSWACSSWSAAWSRSASSATSARPSPRPSATATYSRRRRCCGGPPCCPGSWTTSRTSRPWPRWCRA